MTTLIFGDSFIGPFSLINDNNINYIDLREVL